MATVRIINKQLIYFASLNNEVDFEISVSDIIAVGCCERLNWDEDYSYLMLVDKKRSVFIMDLYPNIVSDWDDFHHFIKQFGTDREEIDSMLEKTKHKDLILYPVILKGQKFYDNSGLWKRWVFFLQNLFMTKHPATIGSLTVKIH